MRLPPTPLPVLRSSVLLVLLLLLASCSSLAYGRAVPSSPGASPLAKHIRAANGTGSLPPAVPAPPPVGR